ncbi:hypothetical protein, partial [Runella limosa]|uniref:hypothetical protein n=1 Tax=Runella limosa TaxID=370978 RepID=UPI00056909D7
DTRNVGGIGSGLVTNTSTNEYFCSIQPAINDADTQDGHTITVAAGTYSEQVIVNKSLIVKGVGATKPIINFTGSVTGKPALFDVSKPNVTIENFDMKVDLTKLSSAIIASGTNISGIIVKDNNVLATGSSASASTGTYTDRNAVSVNYGGTNNYRTAAGGVSAISFTGNTVGGETDAFSMTRYFRSGISVDEGGGTFSGNTLQTINHDVLVRFGSNGAITISNNNFNGGGIELADQNAAAGPISVESNLFNATFANTSAPGAAVLRIKNNYNGIVHTVSSNTFTNFNWAASVENMNNITFNGNTFSGLNSNSRSLVFNTKSISGNSNAISQVAVGMIATNNTFEGQGTALSFLNHDSDNDSYGTFTIGTAGNENTFASSLGTFVFLDGQSGSSNGSTFPTYLTTGQWPTTMECWGQNLNIVNNRFDIGSGLQSPLSMNLSQRTTLEGKLDHKPDVSCKGALQFFLPVHNLTQNTYFSTIQAAITAAVSGDVIECSEATYNESLIFDKSLTLQGVSTDKSLQVLDGTGLG